MAVAEHRNVDTVLRMIVDRLSRDASCALARIWLVDGEELRLVASAGESDRLGGRFSRFAVGTGKIGKIAASREGVLIEDVRKDGAWIADGEWVQERGVRSFAGQPLKYRGEVLGVLAIFSRRPLGAVEARWLEVFARHAAIAIANARAFEEIDGLRRRLEMENEYLREEVSEGMGGILGNGAAIERLRRQIDVVAPTSANVLIVGESGTGKELVARAVHAQSARRDSPLVKVNCASVPNELFESEFFGHVRGAFTGALRDRVGRFQLADGGTLFLDEVGEIPVQLQAKLLRVLQEGEFERVGEDKTRKVDVRVIAATNRNLKEEIAKGHFRQDLYYRLSVFPIVTPTLREHIEDIAGLAQHFVEQAARKLNVAVPKLSEANLAELQQYDWPGNVRELQHVVERALIQGPRGKLVFDLSAKERKVASGALTRDELKRLERVGIEDALRRAKGKIYGPGGAAELLGMKGTTLASRIAALGIEKSGR